MEDRKIMVKAATDSLEDFEQLAIKAKEIGATHVFISALPHSRWQWELDLNDPYSNWGMPMVYLFKLYLPEELHEFYPEPEEAQNNLNQLAAQYEILQKYGLSYALLLTEPFWFPNEVYRAHPTWRGPRIDHPRRSRNLYYSPCIDNPEVLELYRKSMEEICKVVPIDYMFIKSNDAGAGVCWSTGLYAGRNGPTSCRERDMGDRIVGFLNAIKQGAADAGVDCILDFNANMDLKENERVLDMVWPFAPDGVYINGRDNKGNPGKISVGNITSTNSTPVSPVLDIPDVMRVAVQLSEIWNREASALFCGVPSTKLSEVYSVIGRFIENPASDYVSAITLVKALAADLVGEEHANDLFDLWRQIGLAFDDIDHLRVSISMHGTIHQRWLTRPLVAFPDRLEPEERDYYRKYQFQARTEEHANDLMDMQGLDVIRGFSGTFLATSTLEMAEGHFQKAITLAENINEEGATEYAQSLEGLAIRLRACVCMLRNAINTARFQRYLDSYDPENPPIQKNDWPTPGDYRSVEIQNIIRAEIENTEDLISLIRGREHEVLWLTETKEEEDIFIYGPDIVELLDKKIDIMFKYFRESDELFETGNI